jgi:hypothetical protein
LRLTAAFEGNLKQFLEAEIDLAEMAVTAAVKEATTGLKNKMRAQVTAAGLGTRLARTWRGDAYPQRGRSLHAAGEVYTKAEKILSGFEEGTVIRSNDGFWLAIPTPNAPKRVMGQKVTPGNLERARGIRLQFVYRKHGPSLLVANQMRASYSRKTGELRGFRKASQRARDTGRGLTSVVMFWLVPQVKMPKRIRFDSEAANWHRRLPRLILKHWREA